jgi:hypothetical protein
MAGALQSGTGVRASGRVACAMALVVAALVPAVAQAAGQKNYSSNGAGPHYETEAELWWDKVGFDLSMDLGVASVDASTWRFDSNAQQRPGVTGNPGATGLTGSSLGFGRHVFFGPTFRLFPSFILWRYFDAALEWGVLGGLSGSITTPETPPSPPGTGPASVTARPGEMVQAGLRVGGVVPVGPLLFRGTALLGGRGILTDVYVDGPPQGSSKPVPTQAWVTVLEPRGGVDVRIVGPLYAGAYASLDALHPGDWQCGLAITMTTAGDRPGAPMGSRSP